MRGVTWFVVHRDDVGRVAAFAGGFTEERAVERAEQLIRSSVYPMVSFTVAGGKIREMPRWTVHWRADR